MKMDVDYFATKVSNIVKSQCGHVTAQDVIGGFKKRYPKQPPSFWDKVLEQAAKKESK